MTTMSEMGAAAFKARCLAVMERVRRTRQPVTITKHGRPMVTVAPVVAKKPSVLGCLEGAFEIVGDITAPLYSGRAWREFQRRSNEQLDPPARRKGRSR